MRLRQKLFIQISVYFSLQVQTRLQNPTKYHLQQSRNHQIHNFLSQSVKSTNRFPHSMPAQHQAGGSQQLGAGASPQYTTLQTRGHGSSSSMPDPTSPLSVLSSSAHSGGSPSEVCQSFIGHVKDRPSMHYFGFSRHAQPMIAYNILTKSFWIFRSKIDLLECF